MCLVWIEGHVLTGPSNKKSDLVCPKNYRPLYLLGLSLILYPCKDQSFELGSLLGEKNVIYMDDVSSSKLLLSRH